MNFVSSIEIKYFRSIYTLSLKDIKSLNIFSGRNDVGKSNILKALNLFFNDETELGTPISFYKDFSTKRLREVRQESIKGKQFISIKVTFLRGNRCENTLPEKFSVTKKWYRDSRIPDINDDLQLRLKWMNKESSRDLSLAKTSLTRFLNSIRYIYVPAIKDHNVFSRIMGNLQDVIFEDSQVQQSGLTKQLTSLNSCIVDLVDELNLDFHKATGVQSSVSLPTSLRELYKAFFIHTRFGQDNQYKIPLDQRGDGIRIRYIPSILHYITRLSKNNYIWGFEEPENSLEYRLCVKMAEDFLRTYSTNAQIFVTSHSPAFFCLEDRNILIKRIVQENFETKEVPFSDNQEFIDELGITELQKELNQRLKEKLKNIEENEERVKVLEQRISETQKPLVLTEGKTDKIILEEAWKKLHGETTCPFNIDSCDVMPEGDQTGGSGGYETLRKSLEVVRSNNPHIVIGIFDYDKAGFEQGFKKISNNFINHQTYENIKIHKNNRSVAVCLPVPPGKLDFAKVMNLPIEFYFDQEALDTTVEDRKLILIPQKVKITAENGVTIEIKDATELYLMRIEDNKKHFAEKIVPTLLRDKFVNFEMLFNQILSILSELEVTDEATAV